MQCCRAIKGCSITVKQKTALCQGKGRGLSFNLRVYIPPFCGMLDHPKIFECFSDCFLFFQWALWLSGILGLRQIIVLTTPHIFA
jgi:hypothetical protein